MRYLALLRGINVSGKRIIRMDDLKAMIFQLGFANCQTYIQSGNVIFDTQLNDEITIANQIKLAIHKQYGFDVPVIVLKKVDFQEMISKNPFSINDKISVDSLHVSFLGSYPSEENQKALLSFNSTPDQFSIGSRAIYLFCVGKYSDTKLTNAIIEKRLDLIVTTRNWKTCLALNDLLNKNG
ncbi:MAG: DUF1697 domain-containing protein [Bacteroidota bacterium]